MVRWAPPCSAPDPRRADAGRSTRWSWRRGTLGSPGRESAKGTDDMASVWQKAMLYLGLGPDEEYDDYDADQAPAARVRARRGPPARPATAPRPALATVAPPEAAGAAAYGRSARCPSRPNRCPSASGRRAASAPSAPARTRAVVRPLPATVDAKPHVVSPASFNDAQEVADKFKANNPVIMNLQAADRDLSRRLIDFASGLCYGLGGTWRRSPTRCTCSRRPTSRSRPRSAGASSAASTATDRSRAWASSAGSSRSTSSCSSPGSSCPGSRLECGIALAGVHDFLRRLTEPVLEPLRRLIPPMRCRRGGHRPLAAHRVLGVRSSWSSAAARLLSRPGASDRPPGAPAGGGPVRYHRRPWTSPRR